MLSARALMQFPRARRERLMLAPSRNLAPRLVVTVALSDPARSMRDILATRTLVLMFAVRSRCRTNTWKCEASFEHLIILTNERFKRKKNFYHGSILFYPLCYRIKLTIICNFVLIAVMNLLLLKLKPPLFTHALSIIRACVVGLILIVWHLAKFQCHFTWKTACDLDDCALASVGCWVRLVLPYSSMLNNSLAFLGW